MKRTHVHKESKQPQGRDGVIADLPALALRSRKSDGNESVVIN